MNSRTGTGICNIYEFLAYKHPHEVDEEVGCDETLGAAGFEACHRVGQACGGRSCGCGFQMISVQQPLAPSVNLLS